ncbi:hypothetical protein V8F06_006120 [Rhypophila decipiens]
MASASEWVRELGGLEEQREPPLVTGTLDEQQGVFHDENLVFIVDQWVKEYFDELDTQDVLNPFYLISTHIVRKSILGFEKLVSNRIVNLLTIL